MTGAVRPGRSCLARRPLYAVAMTVALVAGCRKAPPEPAAVATPLPPLRIGLSAPPLSFDPHLMNEFVTFEVLSNVMDGLVALDADLRVQPALAERWSSPDDNTWRFDVRKDVTFHDGRPLAATPAASWTRSSRRPPPPPRAWTSRTPSRPACAG